MVYTRGGSLQVNPYLVRTAKSLLPQKLFVTIQSIRSRNYQKQLLAEWGVLRATEELVGTRGTTVLGGPFRGMRYPRDSLLSRNGIPLLFGTYELELHAVVEEVISKQFATIVDIGCAEGYYAVGLAMRTQAAVFAFDCEPRERRYCKAMARANGVADRVRVQGWCDGETLKKLTADRSLVVCDCEGFEFDLFTDCVIPALRASDLIIETHPIGGKDTESLVDRFQKTHAARILQFDKGNTGAGVPANWKQLAREARSPNQEWLYLTALSY